MSLGRGGEAAMLEATGTTNHFTQTGTRLFRGTDGRLRAGWRILIFIALTTAVTTPAMMGVRFLFGGLPRSLAPLVVAPVVTLTIFLCRRYLDKKTFVSLGLRLDRLALADAAFGFILSGVMVAGILTTAWAAGWLQVQGVADLSSALPGLLLGLVTTGLVVAYWEELFIRGYLLQNMADGLGLKWAVLISMAIYGLMHAANPNASLMSGALIALIGFLRAYGWLSTRQLWLSMGMHAGWNFFQGPVFGFGVSGEKSTSWIRHELTGPVWVTGGEFGPEAGLLCLPFLTAGLLAMWLWTRGRLDSETN
jgi:membrane protease YdiL (CAAX protease family)